MSNAHLYLCGYPSIAARNDAIWEWYTSGESTRTIADRLGLAQGTVQFAIWTKRRHLGLSAPAIVRNKGLELPEHGDRNAKMRQMRAEGMKLKDIGRHFGIHESQVQKICAVPSQKHGELVTRPCITCRTPWTTIKQIWICDPCKRSLAGVAA